MSLFKKKLKIDKPPYLERIDQLEHLEIVRLKGKITHDMIPVIEARIQQNRKRQGGIKIEKNILIDYALVEDVDSATVAFHLHRLKDIESQGRKIAFINIPEEFKNLLDLLKDKAVFKIYESEETAIKELNK